MALRLGHFVSIESFREELSWQSDALEFQPVKRRPWQEEVVAASLAGVTTVRLVCDNRGPTSLRVSRMMPDSNNNLVTKLDMGHVYDQQTHEDPIMGHLIVSGADISGPAKGLHVPRIALIPHESQQELELGLDILFAGVEPTETAVQDANLR